MLVGVGSWLLSMNRIEYFISSYLKPEAPWKHCLYCCSKEIIIETPGWPSPPTTHTETHTDTCFLVFLSVRQPKSYYIVHFGSLLLSDRQGHNQFLFSWDIPNNQKLWLFCWKATNSLMERSTSWKQFWSYFFRRMRCLQLYVTNHIRGGKQECFGLQKITLIACWNTTLTGCLSQNSDTGRPSCNSPCQLVAVSNMWAHLRNFLITVPRLFFYLFMLTLQTSLIAVISRSA